MKNTFKAQSEFRKFLADTITPVSLYLKLRDKYDDVILLESSDYHGNKNSFSYLAFDAVASFELKNNHARASFPDAAVMERTLEKPTDGVKALNDFVQAFIPGKLPLSCIHDGLFGYMAYDAIKYFDTIQLRRETAYGIPEICYRVYRFIVAVDHFKNELCLIENRYSNEPSRMDEVETLIYNRNFPCYRFSADETEQQNCTDEEYLEMVKRGIHHCKIGDVFQIVISRRYEIGFRGDEFNLYRALRSVNPSPYLFYFDYGNFKIFGSSPEAQLIISRGSAEIHPIAGTFRRSGDDLADAELAKKLMLDPKENAEHVMLVDLARNDLSRYGENVKVETFKEVQFYSHVIHLVSKVTAALRDNNESIPMAAATFPAGTLSGAPKYRAMQLIDEIEPTSRGYYGGAIGHIGFDGSFNHAIIIRSFLSQGNKLYLQAGGGVVAKSTPEGELQEVHNKLGALRAAIRLAEKITE